ncbi:hypothetical protein B6D60_03760 [candidate division KSB1 bacterium 4484_87]|nr:MAG: hypothetical protein B6D60_03760 [candidate division KSB1 bacterium 4484_87]
MDVKLDSLIEKIRKEGIEEGKKTADELIQDAKKKAEKIVADAKKEADKIVEDGKKQAEQFRANAEADINQAARNTELLLKEKILATFDQVFKREVGDALEPDFMARLIQKLVSDWVKGRDVEVIVSENDKKKLETLLFTGLKKEVKDTITLRASSEVTSGFKIGIKNDQMFYDFTDDAIVDVLRTLINPKLREILDRKDG